MMDSGPSGANTMKSQPPGDHIMKVLAKMIVLQAMARIPNRMAANAIFGCQLLLTG